MGLVAGKEYIDILESFAVVKRSLNRAGSSDPLLQENQLALATFFNDCTACCIEHMVVFLIVPTLLAYLKLAAECYRRFC